MPGLIKKTGGYPLGVLIIALGCGEKNVCFDIDTSSRSEIEKSVCDALARGILERRQGRLYLTANGEALAKLVQATLVSAGLMDGLVVSRSA